MSMLLIFLPVSYDLPIEAHAIPEMFVVVLGAGPAETPLDLLSRWLLTKSKSVPT